MFIRSKGAMMRKATERKSGKAADMKAKKRRGPNKARKPDRFSASHATRPICHDESFVIGGTQMPTTVIGPGPTRPPGWRG